MHKMTERHSSLQKICVQIGQQNCGAEIASFENGRRNKSMGRAWAFRLLNQSGIITPGSGGYRGVGGVAFGVWSRQPHHHIT